MMHLMDPPRGWANPKDCVEFPCTAPENILLKFIGVMSGNSSSTLFSKERVTENNGMKFQIISHNPGVATKFLKPCL